MSSPEFFRSVDFFPVIDEERCKCCMECVRVCNLGVISIAVEENKNFHFHVRKKICRNCRSCVQACMHKAISITAEMGGTFAGHLKKEL